MVSIGALRYDIIADTTQFQQGIVATRKELSAAKRLFNDTRTPAENLGIELEGLARLHKKGAIDSETYRRSVERVTEASKRNERAIEGTTKELKEQRLALLSGIPVVGKFTSQIGAISPGMIAAGAGIGAAVSAMYAGVRAAQAFTRAISEQMTEIDALAKTARKLGATTEGLAGLRLAASEFSGMAATQLDTALQRMTRRLAEAAQGSGEAQGAIRELGLDAAALSAKGPTESFKDIAEAIKQVESPADQLRLAFKLFDSEGAGLVSTLNAGRDAIEGVEAEAAALGVAVTSFDAAQIEAANDAIGRAKASMGGLFNTIAIQLAPAIEQAAKELESMVKSMQGAVSKSLEARVQFAGMVGALQDLSTAMEGVNRIASGDVFGGFGKIKEASSRQGTFRAELEASMSVARSYAASMEQAMGGGAEAGELSPVRQRIAELFDMRQELTKTEEQIEDLKFHNMGASAEDLKELDIARQMLAERKAMLKAKEDERKEVERIAKAEGDARKKRMDELKQQGQAIAQSTRTPFEQLVKDLSDVQVLVKVGAIDSDTAMRQEQALQEAFISNKKPIKVELPPTARTGSAEEFKLIAGIFNGQKDEERRRFQLNFELFQAMRVANERAADAIENLQLAESV